MERPGDARQGGLDPCQRGPRLPRAAAPLTSLEPERPGVQMTTIDGRSARRTVATRMDVSNVTRRQPCSTHHPFPMPREYFTELMTQRRLAPWQSSAFSLPTTFLAARLLIPRTRRRPNGVARSVPARLAATFTPRVHVPAPDKCGTTCPSDVGTSPEWIAVADPSTFRHRSMAGGGTRRATRHAMCIGNANHAVRREAAVKHVLDAGRLVRRSSPSPESGRGGGRTASPRDQRPGPWTAG